MIGSRRSLEQTENPISRQYALADVPLTLSARDPDRLDRVEAILMHHLALGSATNERGLTVEVAAPAGDPPSDRTLIEQGVALEVWKTADGFWLAADDSSVAVFPAGALAQVRLGDGFGRLGAAAQRDLLILPLVMLLRDQRVFVLHASGARRKGTGVLAVGASGSGKTTTTLGLLAAGWDYLGDDLVAVRSIRPDPVAALAVRRTMSCSNQTLRRFGMGRTGDVSDEAGIVPFAPNTLLDRAVDRFVPTIILFPEIATRPSSELVAVGTVDTTVGLVSSMGGSFTDPDWAQIHLQMAAQLAGQCDGYRLSLGGDVRRDPDVLSSLLAEAGVG